jgi:hypothetical protein
MDRNLQEKLIVRGPDCGSVYAAELPTMPLPRLLPTEGGKMAPADFDGRNRAAQGAELSRFSVRAECSRSSIPSAVSS